MRGPRRLSHKPPKNAAMPSTKMLIVKVNVTSEMLQPNWFTSGVRNTLQAYTAPNATWMKTPARATYHRLSVLMVSSASSYRHDRAARFRYRIERCLIDLEMSHDQFRRRVGQPLRERKVLVLRAFEHLEEDQVAIPCVLDVVQQSFFDVADVPRLEVHRARFVPGRHDRHPSLAGDVVLPLVGV